MVKITLWIFFGIILCVLGILGTVGLLPIGGFAQLLLMASGAVVLVSGVILAVFTKLYVRAKANEAFVRTGKGGAKVFIDGGAIVIPFLHEIARIPLETMRLDVDRTGADALITADKLRADLKAEFYIRVQPNKEDVLNAARSLGEKTFNLRYIEELVRDKLISTLRAVAATRQLDELNAKREAFATEVKKGVEADLRHNGLTLESVTVSKLDQTDTSLLNPNNVFDAQGLRRIAEITQNALVERNNIEREAERAKTQKDVETRKLILELEKNRAEAEAAQKAEIAEIQAKREAEARQAAIEQEQFVEAREVEKSRAVEEARITAQKKIIEARREQELTEVERAKSIEMAERQKLSAIAEAEAKRAAAEQARFEAEAKRAAAEQQVKTVEVTAAAEREGEEKLIAARKAAEQDRYRKQVEADVVAYALQKEAEGKKAAAQAEYEARVRQAEAEAESARKKAEGETALKMVDVNVARSQVEVEAARVEVEAQRVDVEAQALANKEKYAKAAIDFELGKLQVEAARDTQVAIAKALAEFLGASSFTMFGDPESARKMIDAYFRGMGLGRTLDGFFAATNGDAQNFVGETGQNLFHLVRAVAQRISGKPMTDAEVAEVLREQGKAEGRKTADPTETPPVQTPEA